MRVGVFIGRFQPFHIAHQFVVSEALQQVDHLIMVLGSADAAPSPRNPWSVEDRIAMISRSMAWAVANGRLSFTSVRDHPSDDRWLADVRAKVTTITDVLQSANIFLVGFNKDQSSFYLNQFPDWGSISIPQAPQRVLSSTDIRHSLFGPLQTIPENMLSPKVSEFIKEWLTSDTYWNLFYEHQAIERYKKAWAGAPFPPVFVTVDAVVVQSGHILLVRRGDYPGKGLLALPGGFINQYERLRDAVVRELKEETQISETQNRKGRLTPARLAGYITEEKVFDNPYRSSRGRTITHAYLFRLPDAKPLWSVKGGDDAATADWYPIDELSPSAFFEDHFSIIQDMLGL